MDRQPLNYNIRDEYGQEIINIQNKLNQLERGRIYDLTGAQMDGYLSTNVEQLRKMIGDLLGKIQDGSPGIKEDMVRASEIMSSIIFK
ncbi:MAG: hypothetical protein K6G30_05225 [Acetatifactor sp.]|nr:hypothetical protein [Acetatifactor sp.]